MIQTVNINVAALPALRGPGSFMVLSQNENGRQLRFRILGSDLPTGCTATFSGTKPDGNVYSTTGTVSGNFVIVQEDIQMTAVAGIWDAKLEIAKGTENIVTSIIRVTVVRDPVAGDAIPSDSQLDGIVTEVKYYAEHARSEAYGSPLTAPTKAQMTDHTRVYVYTGSEPNMVAGNWYHWNGTAWISGGVYNAVAVQTDTTLSVAGKAADGKATGDAIEELKEDLNAVSVPYNLYDSNATYRQINRAGDARTGYTINSDGSISCTRSNGQYGEIFLIDDSRALKAGTYTISGKITLTTDAPDSRSLKICIGRVATAKTVTPTTERGGDTPITIGTKIGWFRATFTLSEDEAFGLMVVPSYGTQADGSHPCLIEELMITSGDKLLDYSADLYSAKDQYARQEINKTTGKIGEISEYYNLYRKESAYTQTNANGTSKTGYTVNSDGTVLCTRSLGNYGQLYLVDGSRTLKAGKYTISGKITLTEDAPTGRQVSVGVGRAGGAHTVNIMTARGGNTRIASGDKVGWFSATITVAADETFALMVIPSESNMVSTNYPCTIEYLMLTDTDFLTDYTDQSDTAIDIIARERIKNAGFLVPDRIFNGEPYTGEYDWQTPVVSYAALFNGKSQVESFAFFTDSHVMGFGDSNRNTVKLENYFKRVQKTVNATPCLFSVCGGDLLNNGTTMDEACYRLGLLKGIMTHLLDGCKLVIGNHDTNYQGKEDSESADWTGRLSNGTIDSILYRDTDTRKAYYSFDGANSKCYVLDSGVEHSTMAPRDWEQVDWLANKLIEDDAEHSIIFLHIIINSGSVQLNASNFASVVEAYNEHGAVTLNGESYNFASCTGKVEFWVAGHTHVDSTGTLGGIPYIITATNSYNSDVPLIDLVLADYNNRTVDLIRVGGTGENRSISLT